MIIKIDREGTYERLIETFYQEYERKTKRFIYLTNFLTWEQTNKLSRVTKSYIWYDTKHEDDLWVKSYLEKDINFFIETSLNNIYKEEYVNLIVP